MRLKLLTLEAPTAATGAGGDKQINQEVIALTATTGGETSQVPLICPSKNKYRPALGAPH